MLSLVRLIMMSLVLKSAAGRSSSRRTGCKREGEQEQAGAHEDKLETSFITTHLT